MASPLEALLKYLKKEPDCSDQAELDRLMKAAIALVERETGWALSALSVTESHSGGGGTRLWPHRAPINSITSLTINGVPVLLSTGYAVPGYIIVDHHIQLRGLTFTKGTYNVALTLNAGYASIPADFVQKLVEIAAWWFTK